MCDINNCIFVGENVLDRHFYLNFIFSGLDLTKYEGNLLAFFLLKLKKCFNTFS